MDKLWLDFITIASIRACWTSPLHENNELTVTKQKKEKKKHKKLFIIQKESTFDKSSTSRCVRYNNLTISNTCTHTFCNVVVQNLWQEMVIHGTYKRSCVWIIRQKMKLSCPLHRHSKKEIIILNLKVTTHGREENPSFLFPPVS